MGSRDEIYNDTDSNHQDFHTFQQRPDSDEFHDEDFSQLFEEFNNVFKGIFGDIDQGRFQIPFAGVDEGIIYFFTCSIYIIYFLNCEQLESFLNAKKCI